MADEVAGGAPTVRERIAYRVDRLLARGSTGPLLWLGAATAILTLLGAIVFTALGIAWGDRQGFGESFWQSFVIAIGKGTIDEQTWTHRIASTLFIFLALFLAGSLIGLLVSAINRRLDLIRRGRSRVLERDHTLVLGASPRLDAVLDELLDDPHDQRPIVVLSQEDKIEMEDRLLARHRSPRRSVIFRTGTPARRADLEIAGISTARAVIVLNSGSGVDAITVRRALAADRFSADDVHVVAEMGNSRVARSLRRSSQGRIATVCIDAAVADMLAQAVRSPGLAAVFGELLSFEGSELYLVDGKEMTGTAWTDLGSAITGAVPVGLVNGTEVVLGPDPERLVSSTDDVLVLALEPKIHHDRGHSAPQPSAAIRATTNDPSRIMVLGWSSIGHAMLRELADHLPESVQFLVLADHDLLDADASAPKVGQTVDWQHTKHDPDEVRATVDRYRPDVLVVLGYQGAVDAEEADALTLLTLHTLGFDGGEHAPRVVAQLLNNELGELADTAAAGDDTAREDVVVTDALVSRLLVHTARDRRLAGVFDELFDAAGPTLRRLPAQPGTWNGRALQVEVAAAGDVLIGVDVSDGVRLNPDLDALMDLTEGDHVVVLSPKSQSRQVATK